ncbi:type IV pilus twitching motility protein PilT [Dickeya fangzhongdai]|uniref:Type IV pili twitching motility protein PilT n=1 Tax=Dickeya fangzhongdai TaxID=1778540 RepID=A0A2K8QQC5_9GAMM|nr:type IV pilus twitching motility protein PilT [Dickeya fangzhongdai]ATZ95701.1 type IV pili twitching motility protein PilT [Dickeya fangzhongdai]QOH49146.1 type IV pilus twitching motility protein PilT [Dickeya fangzhongdai]QOH53449.1 type IV pilus twitching motility protein PilT [Dickeya fangzhongdai]WOX99348.1 type IV pilus twitching motility protein PilT [Dickeya fangzhongdai]WOY05500.1 type IV pilus twitching motility protein PilT [Dickeya fangzhongdai]
MDVSEWVRSSVKQNVSDLHLCSGHPPVWRIDGQLVADAAQPPLHNDELEQWCGSWLEPACEQQLRQSGQTDCALTLPEGQRLRANLFMQRHGLSAALRLIPSHQPDLQALGAPPMVAELADRPDGLILVTGATGSGKSTTLAAMIASLNQRRARHIITLEDPIEFLHVSQRCLIQQREIGRHSDAFASALRAALREDPDVLLLGELRDSETIRLALTAAETGHLVLATLHTRRAVQSVDRLVDVFPAEEKAFVRTQLAASLQAVVAQKLLPGAQGGRVALFEVLLATPAVSNLIREGKTHQLPSLLQTGGQVGMQTFEQSYQQRCREGRLRPEMNAG